VEARQEFLKATNSMEINSSTIYYLFTSLKLHMGERRFSTIEEVKREVENCMNGLAENYF